MNRGNLLNLVFRQCRDQAINGGVGELLVRGLMEGAKRRSVFIAGCEPRDLERVRDEVEDQLQRHPRYEAITYWHGTVEQPNYSQHIPLTSNDLENNWRCRLVANNQVQFNQEHQFYNLVLKSTWRIIVTKRETEYFVRRDIFPYLWSPGHSVAGFRDFVGPVTRELNYLADPGTRIIDELNDAVKGFASGENGEVISLPGLNFSIQELRANFDRCLSEVIETFERHYMARQQK